MQKLEGGQGKNTTFYFAKSFCCFRPNKNMLETAETKQADSQLHFAPKIIEIHLLIFENELIEDAMLVPKKFQNWKPVFYYVWTYHACLGSLTNYTWVKHEFSVLELFWDKHGIFTQLVLEDY